MPECSVVMPLASGGVAVFPPDDPYYQRGREKGTFCPRRGASASHAALVRREQRKKHLRRAEQSALARSLPVLQRGWSEPRGFYSVTGV